MKTYKVVIQAIIEKTIIVQCEDEDDAYDQAHELFDARAQGDHKERYEENTLSCEEVSA